MEKRKAKKKIHAVEKFIKSNDLKLVWLAKEVGVSAEMLRWYFRHDALPEEIHGKALRAIEKKGRTLLAFAKPKVGG